MIERFDWNKAKKAIQATLLLAALFLAPVAGATFAEPTGAFTTACGAVTAIEKVAGWLFSIFLALAVVFLIIAAIFYLTAAGNTTQLTRAKDVLIYSIVAIVIALIAGGLTEIVTGIIGGQGTQC